MTTLTLQKLKEAFLRGYDNVGACVYAGIKESTFYAHCKINPDFLQSKRRWQESLVMAARENLSRSITEDGDINTSKWLLERRKKEEFSLRTESTGADGGAIVYERFETVPTNSDTLKKHKEEMDNLQKI